MKQIIIGIHGLGNKPTPSILKDWWLKSIHEGLNIIGKDRTNIPFEMVYWADIIHDKPFDHTITNKEDPLFEDEPFRKGLSKERKNESFVKEKILEYIAEQLDKIFLNDDLSINFKDITDQLMHHYFRDLDMYYKEDFPQVNSNGSSVKNRIQNRLVSLLKKYKDYKILLIGHSMGSIIAFDVLSNLSEEITINTFITIGSSLGLPVIVGRIFAQQKIIDTHITRPLAPDCITGSWYNMSDKYDKIAIDHTLADDFGPNSLGVGAKDISVYNNYEINGEANPHKSYGYLRTPEIATILDAFLEQKKKDTFYQRYKSFTKNILAGLNKAKKIFKG